MKIDLEKDGLKGYVKALKWLMKDDKNVSKFYTYVMKGGKAFIEKDVRQITAKELREVCFKPKERSCFYNSQVIALFSDLDYYEGWGTTELGIPFYHAWNVKGKKVIDVTWKDGKMYFGVKIPKDFIRKFWLDNSISDTLLARYWDSRNNKKIAGGKLPCGCEYNEKSKVTKQVCKRHRLGSTLISIVKVGG